MPVSVDTYLNVKTLDYIGATKIIRSGDIMLGSGTVFISQMIQLTTNSVWSHV